MHIPDPRDVFGRLLRNPLFWGVFVANFIGRTAIAAYRGDALRYEWITLRSVLSGMLVAWIVGRYGKDTSS